MIEDVARRLSEKWPSSISPVDLKADYSVIQVTPQSIAEHKLRVSGLGLNNIVLLHKNAPPPQKAHLIFNGNDNLVLIDEQCALDGYVICGTGCIGVFLGHQHSLKVGIDLYNFGELFWGKKARTYGARLWIDGGRRVTVGDDCMFSEGIKIRTTDHHSIIDLVAGEQINFTSDVSIEPHVWLGDNTTVMKGVTVGAGAIVGAGSTVTRSVPPAELWVGSPARMLRQGVSWIDSHPATKEEIEALRATFVDRLPPAGD